MPKKLTWWQGAIAMSLLILFAFSKYGADRPLGASTYVPYASSLIFDLKPQEYAYAAKIEQAGSWEALFLIGVFLGALFVALFVTKSFRISYIPTLWIERKNGSVRSRMFWSFISGFIMIFGARMASGCTTGHFMSGMTQMAVSSMIFAMFVMLSLFLTAKLFYRKKEL